MKQVVNYISIGEIVSEYRILENYINRTYGTRFEMSERTLCPIIETHIKAILDERTFTLFRTFDDSWDVSLLDIFINGVLTDEEVLNISRSKTFDILNRSIKSLLKNIMDLNDPNFTIWEVWVELGSDTAYVSAIGDFRIEQWHKEHSVTKLNVTDSLTMDIHHVTDYIKGVLGYHLAPAYLTDKRIAKKSFYSNIINVIIYNQIKDTRNTQEAVKRALDQLQDLNLISNAFNTLENINAYLKFELIGKLEKLNTGRTITSYTIYEHSLVVSYGGRKHHEYQAKTFQELEMELAEHNGDYIPERLRHK